MTIISNYVSLKTGEFWMPNIAIVQWNQDKYLTRAATSIHRTDNKPDRANLKPDAGQSISDFMSETGVSIQEYMGMFPGKLIPRGWQHGQPTESYSWDSQIAWQTLPTDRKSLKRLAHRLGICIWLFYFYDGDRTPKLAFFTGRKFAKA